MKKLLLSILCAFFASMYTYAVTFDVMSGGVTLTYTTTGETTVQVGDGRNTALVGSPTTLVIPATVTSGGKTYNVTSIAAKAFYKCTSLEKVSMPSSLITIGEKAFLGCNKLAEVTIPSSVTTIDAFAFSGCSKLKKANFIDASGSNNDANVVSALCSIEYGGDTAHPLNAVGELYINGNLVSNLTIPSNVASIKYLAFYKCTNIATINFANGSVCSSIGQKAFLGCANLTNLTMPSSITLIDAYAFSGCNNLSIINFVDATGNNNDDTAIAAWCSIEYETESSQPMNIAENLYINGVLLTDVTIPNTVTEIKNFAFYKCSQIRTVSFANNSECTSIGQKAFLGCAKLTEVTIPSSVTTIGTNAFSDCSSIHKVDVVDATGENSNDIAITAWCGINYGNDSAHPFNFGSVDGALYVNGVELTTVTIPNTTLEIKYLAFYKCRNITALDFGNGSICSTIGQKAFLGCTNLATVTIPSSITSIGSSAFSSCENINTVNIVDATGESNNNTAIAAWCRIYFSSSSSNPLYNGSDLKINGDVLADGDLIIPDGVTEISNFAFHNCQNIETVTLPASVTTIGYSFQYCTGITDVYCLGNAATITASTWANIGYENMTLHAPINYLANYVNDTKWSRFNNIVVDALNDGENYVNTNTFSAAVGTVKINYKRVFKNTGWQAWFMPFDMTYDTDMAANFSVAEIMTDQSSEGSITMTYLEEGDHINAGVPYFIKAKAADATNAQTITATITELLSAEDAIVPLECGDYQFVGTFQRMTGLLDLNAWAIASGTLRPAANNTVALPAYRWYMAPTEGKEVKGTLFNLIAFEKGEEDAIQAVTADEKDQNEWYTLSGQRIARPTSKGIYIKNNKKVLF